MTRITFCFLRLNIYGFTEWKTFYVCYLVTITSFYSCTIILNIRDSISYCVCCVNCKLFHMYEVINKLVNYSSVRFIKTHGSESQGQEEVGLSDEQVSYLQVAPL